MSNLKKIVWITWEIQRRNVSMSSSLGANLYEVIYDQYPTILRYIFSLIKTIYILAKERPNVLIVQNPSIVLSGFAVFIKITKIFNFKLIIDAHNAGIFPTVVNRNINLHIINNFILSHANLVIVTNKNLAEIVRNRGGTPTVIEDPIPIFPKNITTRKLKGKINFLFICSYANDEPYFEMIDVARQIDKEFYIYMTGSPNIEVVSILDNLPKNLIVTGYLSEEDYISMLFSADAVIDLTKRKDCLVCGAYEAISALKPLILSNQKALSDYFGTNGVIYASNEANDIVRCIINIVENLETYEQEMKSLKIKLLNCWQKRKEEFFDRLN